MCTITTKNKSPMKWEIYKLDHVTSLWRYVTEGRVNRREISSRYIIYYLMVKSILGHDIRQKQKKKLFFISHIYISSLHWNGTNIGSGQCCHWTEHVAAREGQPKWKGNSRQWKSIQGNSSTPSMKVRSAQLCNVHSIQSIQS